MEIIIRGQIMQTPDQEIIVHITEMVTTRMDDLVMEIPHQQDQPDLLYILTGRVMYTNDPRQTVTGNNDKTDPGHR